MLKTTRLKTVSGITQATSQQEPKYHRDTYHGSNTRYSDKFIYHSDTYIKVTEDDTNCSHLDRSSTNGVEEEPDMDIDEADEEQVNRHSTELYYIDGVHAICVGYL